MDQLLKNLDRSPGAVSLVLIVAVIGLVVAVIAQGLLLKRVRGRWASLMAEASGENLESILERHMVERQSTEERLGDAHERIGTLERKMRSSKRYAGLVRYDAFEDVGGNQSFALALYDEEGNGVIITSQVGREGCRVYGKPLLNGKSERHLSSEEEMAIEQATASRSRPRISP